MKITLIALLFAASCFAQTAQPTVPPKPDISKYSRWEDYNEALIDWKIKKDKISPPAMPQCTTIAKCKLALKTEIDAKDISQAELASRLDDNARLEQENKDLKAKLAETSKQFNDFKALASELYKVATAQNADYTKLTADHTALVDKYNDLLQRANNIINTQNAKLAQQQRLANALALYNAMPKYQPPQTINVNVADCNKNPAFCIH